MPTPSTSEDYPPLDFTPPYFTTCPPEEARQDTLAPSADNDITVEALSIAPATVEVVPTSSTTIHVSLPTVSNDNDEDAEMVQDAQRSVGLDTNINTTPEPKPQSASPQPASPLQSTSLPPTLQRPVSSIAKGIPTHTSSYLRHGSRFTGTQESDRSVYDVSVEIKHVDMSESFVCGYLRIEGLTVDHPTLTTYFEGEIIGTKYTFLTQHAHWGSTDKVDIQHWNRFPAWKPMQRDARNRDFRFKNFAERDTIFMRWKEHFLVPDHRVTSISGASFEGFYYICFNQVEGVIEGIYFHAKSEKFQQLKLRHVDDRGCMSALTFR